jgi:hypothetical protein
MKDGLILRKNTANWQGSEKMSLKQYQTPCKSLKARAGNLLAIREIESGLFLVVVYRELDNDGFIITAFLTTRIRSLERRKQIWAK